jgi:hypothetical protein
MKFGISSKMLHWRLALMAATILGANNVLAAEFVDDAQMQARDLLSGTVGGRAKIVNASPVVAERRSRTSNLDPQEQARELILGERSFGRATGRRVDIGSDTRFSTLGHLGKRREFSDAQELARRMILGVGV